ADERVAPYSTKLVHTGSGADVREILDRDVPAQRGHVSENRVVADLAVVRDVDVRHEHVAIADRRHAAAALRAAVDGDELTEDGARAEDEARFLAAKLEVLRRLPDGGERKNARLVANRRPAVDDGRGADAAVGAQRDVRTDRRLRPDRRPLADARARV